MLRSVSVVVTGCFIHAAPALLVYQMVPAAPTAQPLVAVSK